MLEVRKLERRRWLGGLEKEKKGVSDALAEGKVWPPSTEEERIRESGRGRK